MFILLTRACVHVCADCVIVLLFLWAEFHEWGLCLVSSAICADTGTKAHGKCSPGGVPPTPRVWRLQSVNMSLLITITEGETEAHTLPFSIAMTFSFHYCFPTFYHTHDHSFKLICFCIINLSNDYIFLSPRWCLQIACFVRSAYSVNNDIKQRKEKSISLLIRNWNPQMFGFSAWQMT